MVNVDNFRLRISDINLDFPLVFCFISSFTDDPNYISSGFWSIKL